MNAGTPASPVVSSVPADPAFAAVPARGRVEAIDVLRGLFMCVVILSHAMTALRDEAVPGAVRRAIHVVTESGTPGFAMVSGMVLGYFLATGRELGTLQRKYGRRTLQLLCFAHLAIAAVTYAPAGEGGGFLRFVLRHWYITDTLAVLFLVAPLALVRLSPAVRLALAAAMLATSRFAFSFLFPDRPGLQVVAELLFGVDPHRPGVLGTTYPLLPIGAYFLAGSVVGHFLAQAFLGGKLRAFRAALAHWAWALLATSCVLVVAWALVKRTGPAPESTLGHLRHMLYPDRYFSLAGAYFALILLLVNAALWRLPPGRRAGAFERALQVLGRTSLSTYVVQYVVIETIPYYLGFYGRLNAWELVVFLAAGYVLIYLVARTYEGLLRRTGRRSAGGGGGGQPVALAPHGAAYRNG